MCRVVGGLLLNCEKEKEILPFAAARVDLEGIVLREVSQRKTNAACGILKSNSL